MRKAFFVGLLSLLSLPMPAQAQTYGVFDMGVLTTTLAQDHVTQSERARAQRQTGSAGVDQLAQALSHQVRQPGSSAPALVATYTPNQAVRERLADIMAEAAGRERPAQAEEMRRLVLSQEALNEYVRIAPSLGYRANDVVDALAFYLLAQWGVANDHRADVTRAQAAAVRRQAANAYSQVADQLASDARRQEFAEMLAIQGTIMAGTHEAAVRSGDDAALRRYATLARRGGRLLFTMDPTAIRLTDAGFQQSGTR